MDEWSRLPEAHFDALCCRGAGGLADVLARLAGARWCVVLSEHAVGERALAACGERTLGAGDDGRLLVGAVPPARTAVPAVDDSHACTPPLPEGGLRVVDNSAVGPWMRRPLAKGADVVVERLSEWLGLAGVAVYARTDAAGSTFLEGAGLTGCAGGPSVPLDGLASLALGTASLRMQRRCDTALVLASYLAAHPAVAWVSYPGLAQDPAHDEAHRALEHGAGPLVTFGLVPGVEAAGVLERAAALPCLAPAAPDAAPDAPFACDLTRLAPASGGALLVDAGLETPMDVVRDLEVALGRR